MQAAMNWRVPPGSAFRRASAVTSNRGGGDARRWAASSQRCSRSSRWSKTLSGMRPSACWLRLADTGPGRDRNAGQASAQANAGQTKRGARSRRSQVRTCTQMTFPDPSTRTGFAAPAVDDNEVLVQRVTRAPEMKLATHHRCGAANHRLRDGNYPNAHLEMSLGTSANRRG